MAVHVIISFPQDRMGCQEVDGEREEERMRLKKMGFHELLYTEVVKCGTIIRLTSG